MARGARSVTHGGGCVVASLCLLGIVLGSSVSVRACEVPVHRYMLYMWGRDLYRAYYFYGGREEEGDRAANDFLKDAGSSLGSNVNLSFRAVDVERLGSSPLAGADQQVWDEHRTNKLPFHLVLTPRESVLFCGRLELATAKAMLQSSARTRIARELSAGKAGLLLLLEGDDRKENQLVEKDAGWVLERAREEHGLDVGYLRVSRKDPDEKWLVRVLLDLVEEPSDGVECMVFAICGRGRVLAACTGEGITPGNLLECVGIMNGDCSCDLRFANPGMDLLTDWDWEGAIANLSGFTEWPLRSGPPGFEDLEGNRAEPSSAKAGEKGEMQTTSFFRGSALTWWGVALGIVSVTVVGVGLIMVRRRKEV